MLCRSWSTAWKWPSFRPVFDFVQTFLFPIKSLDLNHVECIQNQMALNRKVKWTIGTQTWAQVYLHQPWFKIWVQQNIKTKDFIAILSMHLILFHRLEHIMLATGECLDQHIENPWPQQAHIDANCFKMLTEGWQTPLKAKVIIFWAFILYKVFIFLVDWVIREMHILVIFVELGCICLWSESCKAFLVDIDSQRFIAGYHNIDSKIEFVAIDEQRIGDISGDYAQFIYIQIVYVVNNVNPSASARVAWFHNPNIPPGVRLFQLVVVV